MWSFLNRERRIFESRRRQRTLHSDGADPASSRRPSRFDVTPVEPAEPQEGPTSRSEAPSPDAMNNVPLKSILKVTGLSCPGTDSAGELRLLRQTITWSLLPDSKIRQALDNWYNWTRGKNQSSQVSNTVSDTWYHWQDPVAASSVSELQCALFAIREPQSPCRKCLLEQQTPSLSSYFARMTLALSWLRKSCSVGKRKSWSSE